MTNAEAITFVKAHKEILDESDLKDALDIAVDMMEKQIPKRAMTDRSEGHWGHRCECGGQVWIQDTWCPKCGQLLDWSEYEKLY